MQRLTAEIEGTRLVKTRNENFFDPYIAILNAERFELATSDDAPLLQQDCVCSVEAPEPTANTSSWFATVRLAAITIAYRLACRFVPKRPIAVVPAGGASWRNDRHDVRIDHFGRVWTEKITAAQ